MFAYRRLMAATLIAALCTSSVSARSDDHGGVGLTIDALPAIVREAVLKALGNGRLEELSTYVKNDRTLYEAEFTLDGVEHEAVFTEAGVLVETVIDIAISAVPDAVVKAVRDKYPSNMIEEAEIVTRDGKTFYRLSIELEKNQERELELDTTGVIVFDTLDD